VPGVLETLLDVRHKSSQQGQGGTGSQKVRMFQERAQLK